MVTPSPIALYGTRTQAPSGLGKADRPSAGAHGEAYLILVRASGPARVHATPSLRRMSQRHAAAVARRLHGSRRSLARRLASFASATPAELRRGAAENAVRWSVNVAVALLVLSLPAAASAASATARPERSPELLAVAVDAPRAQSLARGATLSAGRSPVTVDAGGTRPIHEYKLGAADTLASLSNFYGVSPEAIAYANGITDPLNLEVGRGIRIPPGEGALYTVVEGDTVESVAAKFKADPASIKDYNRLHFEPEHFAPGKLLFVPGAELPGLVYQAAAPAEAPQRPSLIARAPAPQVPAVNAGGGLLMPVRGVITQYMWAGHTGIDVAAPFGTALVAGRAGIVTDTGWVPVGGLRVCVTSGALENCYYHTGAVFVAIGQYVERGQPVASIGMTGVTTGPHVHWETKVNGRFVNPLSQ